MRRTTEARRVSDESLIQRMGRIGRFLLVMEE